MTNENYKINCPICKCNLGKILLPINLFISEQYYCNAGGDHYYLCDIKNGTVVSLNVRVSNSCFASFFKERYTLLWKSWNFSYTDVNKIKINSIINFNLSNLDEFKLKHNTLLTFS